jgi:hypothetical protein
VVVASALVLSLSRGGWIGAILGVSTLGWLRVVRWSRWRRERLPLSRRTAAALSVMAFVLALGAVMLVAGGQGMVRRAGGYNRR